MKSYATELLLLEPIEAQLLQLTSLTWDGDLISKSERNNLVKVGLAIRMIDGWNLVTEKGVEYLLAYGIINA